MANELLTDAVGDAATLTALINKSPFNPGTIARLKLFDESGISTVDMVIDREEDALTILPTVPRGGVASPHLSGASDGIKVSATHIPTRTTIHADQIQDRRQPGTNNLDSIERVRAKHVMGMRKNLEGTIEHQRYGAIKGLITDVDGSELLNVYAAFGVTQVTKAMALASTSRTIVNVVIDAERASEDALGGETPSEYVALCAPDFMDALRANPSYSNDIRYARPSELLNDFRTGITIGNTTFIEVRSTPGLPVRIPAGEGYLVPMGIADLLITRYAPGDYLSTVNTPGLPLYANIEEGPMGKCVHLEAQSNPLSICTRPRSIIRLLASE